MILSIVVPTYCRAEALKHSLPQTLSLVCRFPDAVELIVSDNASPDDSFETAKRLCRDTPNAILNRQDTNLGFEGNSMAAFGRTHGKYVWFLGDDDQLIPDHFEELVQQLRICEAPLIFLPCKGIPECDEANRLLVELNQPFALKTYTCSKGTEGLAESLAASAFLAFTVFRRDILLNKMDQWQDFAATWYGRWRITLLEANAAESWVAANKIMSHGNYWEELQTTLDYQKTRSYRMQVVVRNRIVIWKELSKTRIGKLLHMWAIGNLLGSFFRRSVCAGEFRETIREGLCLFRLLPLESMRFLFTTPFAIRYIRGWLSVYILRHFRRGKREGCAR